MKKKKTKKRQLPHVTYRVATSRPITVGPDLYRPGSKFSTEDFPSDYREACDFLCENGLLSVVVADAEPEPEPETKPETSDLADLI